MSGATALARHALGLGNGQRVSYRNRYICGPGHDAFAEWERMVSIGDAVRLDRGDYRKMDSVSQMGGNYTFQLTLKGAMAALRAGERLDPEDFPAALKPHGGGE